MLKKRSPQIVIVLAVLIALGALVLLVGAPLMQMIQAHMSAGGM